MVKDWNGVVEFDIIQQLLAVAQSIGILEAINHRIHNETAQDTSQYLLDLEKSISYTIYGLQKRNSSTLGSSKGGHIPPFEVCHSQKWLSLIPWIDTLLIHNVTLKD